MDDRHPLIKFSRSFLSRCFRNHVRVFLDVVGVIAGTPALNSALDVKGHTANAFCHVCSSNRNIPCEMYSRFLPINQHGVIPESTKTWLGIQIIQASNLRSDSFIQIGFFDACSTHSLCLIRFAQSLQGEVASSDQGIPRQ